MSILPVYVGLDYHQDAVQVCVMDSSGQVLLNRSCRNDWQEIVKRAAAFGDVRGAAIESCTGAADLADELVNRAGWQVDMAHPGYVARMKQNPDKTDYSDARLLADLERVGYLPKVWQAPLEVRELRMLVRYRQQLVAQRRNIKLRVGAILRQQRIQQPAGGSWTKRWKAWLDSLNTPGADDDGSRRHQAGGRSFGKSNVCGPVGACIAGAFRDRPGDSLDDSCGDWSVRSLPQWQAVGSVLCPHSA